MPCRWKQSRISCACRYSNAAIAQPVRQVLLTPAPVIGRRVEGPERRVVHNRFMGVNERVAKAHFQRSPRRRFELRQPLGRDRRLLNGAALHSALFQLVSVHGRLLHYFSDPSQPKPVPNPSSPPTAQRTLNGCLEFRDSLTGTNALQPLTNITLGPSPLILDQLLDSANRCYRGAWLL